MIDTFWGHQLIAKLTYDDYIKNCVKAIKPNPVACLKLEVAIEDGVGNLNPYALDYPVCITNSKAKVVFQLLRNTNLVKITMRMLT